MKNWTLTDWLLYLAITGAGLAIAVQLFMHVHR